MNSYDLDRAEVLRYLGYGKNANLDNENINIDSELDYCEEELHKLSPKTIWKYYDIMRIDEEGVWLEGFAMPLRGSSMAKLLENATGVVLMAGTLGIENERKLKRLSLSEMSMAVVYDAASSGMIERVMDALEQDISAELEVKELFTGFRFSPGYGDFPLEQQNLLLSALEATKKLGLMLTDTNLMIPMKSVSAVMGVYREKPEGMKKSCAICNMKDRCQMRKSYDHC